MFCFKVRILFRDSRLNGFYDFVVLERSKLFTGIREKSPFAFRFGKYDFIKSGMIDLLVLDWDNPVSYTHLDVYKRQWMRNV